MLIKFKKPDPRAGMVARMDSSRGQQLIDSGSADRMDESIQPAQPDHPTLAALHLEAGGKAPAPAMVAKTARVKK